MRSAAMTPRRNRTLLLTLVLALTLAVVVAE